MNNFTYCTPTRYIFGRGAENEAARLAAEAGWKRVLVVYGQGSVVRSGLLGRINDSLSVAGIEFAELSGVEPNPTDPKVREGITLAREFKAEAVLAVGGGSAIDTAKAIALGVPYDGDFWDFYAGKQTPTTALPVGVVLTIPAAGSEGSGNSVITLVDGMRKISLRTDTVLRPRFACLNPELTFTLPPFQTACGIADMMAHILERYFSPTHDVEVTDRVAEGLLKAIMGEAPKVMSHPDDYEARANIMWAGTLAHNGVCGCGRTEDWTSHFLEHEISALYGVTHGAGLAVVVPAWMTFMLDHKPEKIIQFAHRVMNIDAADPREAALLGIAALRDFFRSLELPVTMAELGIANPDIPLMVTKLHQNKGERIGGYFPFTASESAEIYRLCL